VIGVVAAHGVGGRDDDATARKRIRRAGRFLGLGDGGGAAAGQLVGRRVGEAGDGGELGGQLGDQRVAALASSSPLHPVTPSSSAAAAAAAPAKVRREAESTTDTLAYPRNPAQTHIRLPDTPGARLASRPRARMVGQLMAPRAISWLRIT
jgi:Tfp pilus assembly protein FimV